MTSRDPRPAKKCEVTATVPLTPGRFCETQLSLIAIRTWASAKLRDCGSRLLRSDDLLCPWSTLSHVLTRNHTVRLSSLGISSTPRIMMMPIQSLMFRYYRFHTCRHETYCLVFKLQRASMGHPSNSVSNTSVCLQISLRPLAAARLWPGASLQHFS
jgi:hypothetical protein